MPIEDQQTKQINPCSYTFIDGKNWFDQGFKLFSISSSFWTKVFIMFIVIVYVLVLLLQNYGMFVVVLFGPAFTAGTMLVCRDLELGLKPTLYKLTQAIREKPFEILILGVLNLGFMFLNMYLFPQPVDSSGVSTQDITADGQMALSGSLSNFVLQMLVTLPIALMMYFAPALIIFNKLDVVSSLNYSISGILRHWKPLLMLILIFLAMIIIPVFVASIIINLVAGNQAILSLLTLILTLMFVVYAVVLMGIGIATQYITFRHIFISNELSEKKDNDPEIHSEF